MKIRKRMGWPECGDGIYRIVTDDRDGPVARGVLAAVDSVFSARFSEVLKYNSATTSYLTYLCKRAGIHRFIFYKLLNNDKTPASLRVLGVKFKSQQDYLMFALKWIK